MSSVFGRIEITVELPLLGHSGPATFCPNQCPMHVFVFLKYVCTYSNMSSFEDNNLVNKDYRNEMKWMTKY